MALFRVFVCVAFMAMIASNEALKCMKKKPSGEEEKDTDCGDNKSCKIQVLTEITKEGEKNVTTIKEVLHQGCDPKNLDKLEHEQDKKITFYCKKENCNTKDAMKKQLKDLKAGASQISFAVATIVLGVVINRLTL